jgi:hypothetical protein
MVPSSSHRLCEIIHTEHLHLIQIWFVARASELRPVGLFRADFRRRHENDSRTPTRGAAAFAKRAGSLAARIGISLLKAAQRGIGYRDGDGADGARLAG